MLAVVGGLLLGVVLTSVLETLDESVKSKDDLRAATDGLPVLASIPSFEGTDGYLVEDGTVAGEAYRMLRTSVQLLGVARPLRTVLITSASSGEGKTTTVVNLAKVFATTGQNVVVVDCDLRRPRLHEVLECSNRIGFTSLLLDEVTLDGALQPVPGHERLMLVASGHLSPNPSELLSSKQAAQVFFDLQSRFDVVLIDCPPVLPVTDATLLSAWVDATVLVASADQTSRKQLKSTIDVLRQVDAPLKGTVLNRARVEKSQYYSYAAGGPMRTGAVPVASNNGHIDRQAEAPGRVEPKGTEALPRSGGTATQL
jgi:capsular exopolysaccharide synthesis family protein